MSEDQTANPQDVALPEEGISLEMAIEPMPDAPLAPPPPPSHTAVLHKLSSPPFPRSGFPLLGILASVYEHVMSVAARTEVEASAISAPPPDRAA